MWPDGAKAAVSVCYQRCPQFALRRLAGLSARKVGATVFVQPTDLLENPGDWRAAVDGHHEIGNASLHTLTADGTLPNWTFEMIEDDLEMADSLFGEFDSKADVFAVPGSTLLCADGAYDALLRERYDWIVSTACGINHPVFCQPKSLLLSPVTPQTISDTLDSLEDAVDRGAWCILSFDLRSEVVRRFHDAFMEVVPHSVPGVLWQPIGEIGQIVGGFRAQLTLR